MLDQLENAPAMSAERTRLMQVRDVLRGWRHDHRLVFRTKSIIVVEGIGGAEQRPLATLQTLDGKADSDDR